MKTSTERVTAWRKENRERHLQQIRDWHRNDRLNNPARYMLVEARSRAKKKQLMFNLTIEDICIPEYCPVLGIHLERIGKVATDASPSLDRLNSQLGYIKGNVRVISWRANNLKKNATADELERIISYIRNECQN